MNDLENNPNYNQAITFLMGVIKNQEQLSECITDIKQTYEQTRDEKQELRDDEMISDSDSDSDNERDATLETDIYKDI